MDSVDDRARQDYLAEPHVGIFAVERPGKVPLAAPIWYGYKPGGTVQLWTSPGSPKARLIDAAGRFSLVVQDEQPPYRWVRAEGPVVGTSAATVDAVAAIARRYVSGDELQAYLDIGTLGEYIIIEMQPERLVGWEAD